MIESITPVIFTYNEAPNIRRVLERLAWAQDIVVVDSFSDDDTLQIIAGFPAVRVFQRTFDCAANQLNFALDATEIVSEWVLALDADYILSGELIQELKMLRPPVEVNGYQSRFIYSIFGTPLRACIYPPRVILFRRVSGHFLQDGHTQKLSIKGKILNLQAPVIHDDRKSFKRWLDSQRRYAEFEADKLARTSLTDLSWPDRIRKMRILAPPAILLYCLFFKGLFLDGWRGLYYSFQRMLAELFLSLRLIERDFEKLNSVVCRTK